MAYGCRNNVAVLDKFDADGVLVFIFKKHAFVDRILILRGTRIFSVNTTFTSSKFHRSYSRGLQL